MASAIENHAEEVFAKLERGASYQAISDWLLTKGVTLTRASVCSWYLRKQKKIKKRSLATNGVPMQSIQFSKERSVSEASPAISLEKIIIQSEKQAMQPTQMQFAKQRKAGFANMASSLLKGVKK